MTLESVVTRMGIPMERPFHDALSDTLYTADICRKLDLRAGIAAYPTEEEALRASLCAAPAITGISRSSRAVMWTRRCGGWTPPLPRPSAPAAGPC